MQKPLSKKNNKKTDKNTFCNIPLKAQYSLKDGILTREQAEYANITVERFGKYIVGRLGIDLEDPVRTNA